MDCSFVSFVRKIKAPVLATASALLFCACASIPKVQPLERELEAKCFAPPPAGWSGLCVYVVRDDYSAALNKTRTNKSPVDVFVDGQYAGTVSYGLFLLRNLRPGSHTLRTRAGWSLRDIEMEFDAEEGKTHFYQIDIDIAMMYIGFSQIVNGQWTLRPMEFEAAWNCIAPFRLAADGDSRSRDLKTADYGEMKGSVPAALDGLTAGQ